MTEGDRSPAAISQLGGTGVFVTALREALLAGRVDLAVHSLKDLPTAPAPGIALAAVPLREDPRDALVCPAGLSLGELPPGARIGTGSPRRTAQLHALGLGFDVVPIRGNVDTRIRKAVEGEVDAVVLARAGLARLDRLAEITEVLDPLQMLPAPGQGALAVECREGDDALRRETRGGAGRRTEPDGGRRRAGAARRARGGLHRAGRGAGRYRRTRSRRSDEPGAAVNGVGEIYLRGVAAAVDGSSIAAAVGHRIRRATRKHSGAGSPPTCSRPAPQNSYVGADRHDHPRAASRRHGRASGSARPAATDPADLPPTAPSGDRAGAVAGPARPPVVAARRRSG